MPILKATGLTKRFGNFTALDGVDMELNKGEVYGFIGPNGAGKSTTIRILLGMLKATAGEAHIFGKDVWKDAVELHKQIAYVPGDVNLWPNLTGGEVIDLFMKMRGAKNRGKKEELMKRFKFNPTKKAEPIQKGTGRRLH